jgi:hypothetical protein
MHPAKASVLVYTGQLTLKRTMEVVTCPLLRDALPTSEQLKLYVPERRFQTLLILMQSSLGP